MEFLKIKNIDENNYKEFISKIEKLKDLLKENKKYETIYEPIESINKKNIYLYLLLFKNYEKWININHFYNYININQYNISKENNKKVSLYLLLIIWSFYLYEEFIKYFYEILNPNYTEVNRIRYLLRETNNLLVKLYKQNILNTNQIFTLMKSTLFLIETNFDAKSYSDKLYKAKNYLLLKGLFFLLQEISSIIINKANLNKNNEEVENRSNIQQILSFLEDFQKNNEINSQLTMMILISYNLIPFFMNKILDKIDIKIMVKYEPKFKNKLLNFFSHFLKFNYKKSKIYNTFLNSLKQSFINLYYFENNKEKIIHDLFKNNFYTKLLKKIIYFDEKNINSVSRPLFNSFYFNGFDSQISLNIQNNTLEKSSLFFSFYLSPIKGKIQYPLFLAQKDFDGKKNDLLFLYLKQSKDNKGEEFDLHISCEQKEIKLENIPKIKKNMIYYFSLCFNVNKLLIYFSNKKEEIFSTEINKNNKLLAIKSISLLFGFYKKRSNVFSGYFGPIINIRNPKNSKELKKFIYSILNLEYNYRNYIFLDENSNFFTEEDIIFKKNKNNELSYQLEKLDILLYLIPDNFRFFSDKSGVVNHLPNLDSICKYQRSHNVYNLNVTLIKHEQGIINFIMDNGLNYICLLYEYIYQFCENYTREEIQKNKTFEEDKEIIHKMISSIFKKTLFIVEKSYNEINPPNFNKPLKQIYMSLFSNIKLISKKFCIINELIDNIFDIIKYFSNYIFNFIKQKKLLCKSSIELKNTEIINDNILYINLCSINGWLDFLLNPQIYDFNRNITKNILKKLFTELSDIFIYLKINITPETINQALFSKLLSFIPNLNNLYSLKDLNNDKKEDGNNTDNQSTKEEENEINCAQTEKDIFDIYLMALKNFFNNNPSKSGNIMNLKDIFKIMGEELSKNNQIFCKFYNFISDLINNEPDLYFNDDKDDEKIRLLIKYGFKFCYSNSTENTETKNEKEVSNKRNLLNKLICILIRIIYSKQRIGRNDTILRYFKKLLEKVDKTNDFIITIINEIINVFYHIFGANNSKNNKEKKQNIYGKEELKNLSNFYYEIFDLILYFLEYPYDNNDKKNMNNINIEKIIADLLSTITNLIKPIIENINNNYIVIRDNYIDIIFCIISFLKFYHDIFFKKTYSMEYIQNFELICDLCCKSSLIHSSILIEIDNISGITKTPLEIILDICIFYLTLTSSKYCENLADNDITKEEITDEQRIIYDLLNKIFFPKFNYDSKDESNKYTIFFINDYLRLLSTNYPIHSNKRPKNDQFYSIFLKEFILYQNIDKIFANQQKYTFNCSTFFILKCNGYKKIIIELNVKIDFINSQLKNGLKIDEIMTLLIEVIQKNYNEHEILFSKNKNFFFSKKITSSYKDYSEIRKKIESNLKKNNYPEIDDFILNNIFSKDFDNVYTLVYSGRCLKKFSGHKLSEVDKEEPKEKKILVRHAVSSINLIKDIKKGQDFDRTFSNPKNIKKSVNLSSSPSEKESSISQDDYDFELQIEETPSSENNKCDEENSLKNDFNLNIAKSNYSSPVNYECRKNLVRKQTDISEFSLSDNNLQFSDKKRKNERNFSYFSELSEENNFGNNIAYLNYFYQPDECYLRNAKKELMMNIFSIFFVDSFFNNEQFKIMKYYYLQNFDGIQKSTKLLDYPSKIKNFNNGLEPNLFLKPFSSFFEHKIFPITHKYFYEYIKKNNVPKYEPIILYKKEFPEIDLEEKFDKKCELIKINHSYYGHIIGSKNVNYMIFKQQKYEFYDMLTESKNKILNLSQPNNLDLNDLFTLSNVNKKPFNKERKRSFNKDEKINEIKKYKRNKTVVILFEEIEEILERRFLLMWQAIEVYLKNGKSYFFNFLSKETYEFILYIFKNNKITKNKIHEKDFYKIHQKNLITEWEEERLSTYEYLLLLNKYSSRTFNDANQYPIFPWLIRKYYIEKETHKIELIYRDFKYPMAAQIEENRITALNRFQDDEESKVKFPTHFGTHYSTSSYVYFFLMREEPFTTLLVKLQGYKQENPDRMFFSLDDTLFVLETGSDNRECIPDVFCKTEQFINLNCADFGNKNCGLKVDDFIINDLFIDKNNNNYINNYVQFIIENKKLLDAKKIANTINEWFDIIFGIGQLPEKNMRKCLNIFSKETYEQKTNLHEKLIKLQNKYNLENVIKKIENKIDLIISFGQTPYQILNEKHPKNERKKKNKDIIENEDDDGFESCLNAYIWEKDIRGTIESLPIFFEINISLGKVFLIYSNRQIDIIDSNYYNSDEDSAKHFTFSKFGLYQLSHIKFFEKIKIVDNPKNIYYIINPKYSFSSFNEKEIINNNDFNNNDYNSYYNIYINKLYNESQKQEQKKGKTVNTPNKDVYFRFISCRYMDNSFKIHHILKNKPKKEEKPISIVCEDFVSSCCTMNYNHFLIGLKNGKLIQWSIDYKIDEGNSLKKTNFTIKSEKQIQAHKKSITLIEINTRLGIIITAGEDNYLFLRKIYDFESITPIKIKSKYIITMAKVSPMNFLYIICFNKKKQKYKSIIFGYTLNGLYFAKSKYGYYDNIDFTKNGNIVTFGSKKEIEILSGNNLKNIINKDDKDMNEVQKKIAGASWINFNYFCRKKETQPIINKTVTYSIYDKIKGENAIKALDVSRNKYFA